jgi:hypothetical protein
MQKHNEKDPKNAVNNVTANLVIDFLKDHRHVAIASELLKVGSETWFKLGSNLHGLKLADLVSFFSETQTITKFPPDNWYIHGIVASLVIDFLKDHEHHGIASDLMSVFATLNLPELHGLKLSDLFSYFFQKNTEEKVSECKKTKVASSAFEPTELDQYMSSVKVVLV